MVHVEYFWSPSKFDHSDGRVGRIIGLQLHDAFEPTGNRVARDTCVGSADARHSAGAAELALSGHKSSEYRTLSELPDANCPNTGQRFA
jgi:hypothetical protein